MKFAEFKEAFNNSLRYKLSNEDFHLFCFSGEYFAQIRTQEEADKNLGSEPIVCLKIRGDGTTQVTSFDSSIWDTVGVFVNGSLDEIDSITDEIVKFTLKASERKKNQTNDIINHSK